MFWWKKRPKAPVSPEAALPKGETVCPRCGGVWELTGASYHCSGYSGTVQRFADWRCRKCGRVFQERHSEDLPGWTP